MVHSGNLDALSTPNSDNSRRRSDTFSAHGTAIVSNSRSKDASASASPCDLSPSIFSDEFRTSSSKSSRR